MSRTHALVPCQLDEEPNQLRKAEATAAPVQLLDMAEGLIIHQALYAVAKLGVADLLKDGPQNTADLARELDLNEPALYRLLRALASREIFAEIGLRRFANNDLSHFLRTGIPGSVRALTNFRGSKFFFASFGEILYSVRTGESARTKIDGQNGFETLRRDPEAAAVFDDAMTNLSQLFAPGIASAYDFGQWGSVIDVGGGNGVLLAEILKVHTRLRGVLADQPHVLERARVRGFLSGDLAERSAMQNCDFFAEIPSGCRACVMKSVLVDWNDEQARDILLNCRKAIPEDGALLIVDYGAGEDDLSLRGAIVDIVMLVLTGGKVRTVREYRNLFARGGFRLNQVIPVPGELSILEALPA